MVKKSAPKKLTAILGEPPSDTASGDPTTTLRRRA
jgi:hypothetical protein